MRDDAEFMRQRKGVIAFWVMTSPSIDPAGRMAILLELLSVEIIQASAARREPQKKLDEGVALVQSLLAATVKDHLKGMQARGELPPALQAVIDQLQ